MKLVFIRHGDPDYVNDGLTEEGKIQARGLAKYMQGKHVDAVYSSPLGRAYQTALACYPAEKISVRPWLREFTHPIVLDDGSPKDISWDFMPSYLCTHPELYNMQTYLSTPEMTSGNIEEFYREVANGIDEVLAQHGYERCGRYYRTNSNQKTLVFFCHLGVMSVIMSHLAGISHILLGQHFCALPSSITTFVTEERQQGIAQFRCLSYGATPHLDKIDREPSFAARFCEIFDSPDRH